MITDALIDDVIKLVSEKGPSEETVFELRQTIPGIQFTYCFDDDVCGPKPARETDTFNLYYVNSGGHCTSFTPTQEAATGIVIAEIDDFCA